MAHVRFRLSLSARARPSALRLLSVVFVAASRPLSSRAAGAPLHFNKAVYEAAVKCSLLGWHVRRRQYLRPFTAQLEQLASDGQAFEMHVLAAAPLAPNTVELPEHLPVAEAAALTRERMREAVCDLVASGEATAIFQPTFLAGQLVARADAIVLASTAAELPADPDAALRAARWDVVEVKSVLATNAASRALDVAFTVHVAESAGVRVRNATLYAVNKAYRLETAATVPLYARVDLTTAVREHIARTLAPRPRADDDDDEAAEEEDEVGTGADERDGAPPTVRAQAGRPSRAARTAGAVLAAPAAVAQLVAVTDTVTVTGADAALDGGADEPSAASAATLALAALGAKSVAVLERATGGADAPARTLSLACKGCPAVADCTGAGVAHPVWELPRIGQRAFDELHALLAADAEPPRVAELLRAPAALLTPAQATFQRAVARGDGAPPRADDPPRLRKALGEMVPPFYYLDFEAAMHIFPPFRGLAPYETVLTQFSLHVVDPTAHGPAGPGPPPAAAQTAWRGALDAACDALATAVRPVAAAPGPSAVRHAEYLAEPTADCREPLLRALVDALDEAGDGRGGSIVVYSSYERTQLLKLAAMFPGPLGARAEAAALRLVDLEPLVRTAVSHALFRGRSSLKVALPVLAPALSEAYAEDAIGDGGTAAAVFSELGRPGLEPAEAARLREGLLNYCALDTRAMVELHRALLALVEGEAAVGASAGGDTRPVAVAVAAPAAAVASAVAPPAAAGAGRSATLADGDVDRLLVRELKEELGRLGQVRTGNKAELAARLKAALRESGGRQSDDMAGQR